MLWDRLSRTRENTMPTVQFLTRTWMAALRDNCFGPQSHLCGP